MGVEKVRVRLVDSQAVTGCRIYAHCGVSKIPARRNGLMAHQRFREDERPHRSRVYSNKIPAATELEKLSLLISGYDSQSILLLKPAHSSWNPARGCYKQGVCFLV